MCLSDRREIKARYWTYITTVAICHVRGCFINTAMKTNLHHENIHTLINLQVFYPTINTEHMLVHINILLNSSNRAEYIALTKVVQYIITQSRTDGE